MSGRVGTSKDSNPSSRETSLVAEVADVAVLLLVNEGRVTPVLDTFGAGEAAGTGCCVSASSFSLLIFSSCSLLKQNVRCEVQSSRKSFKFSGTIQLTVFAFPPSFVRKSGHRRVVCARFQY